MTAQPRPAPAPPLRLVPQPRAALYVRVSTERQEENYSLATQEARCREYAAQHGYAVADVYRETHTGTELWERPELTRLRQAMARRELDALICFDPDRLSRKQAHTALLQGICEQAGVELRFAEFDFTRDATGQFLLNARVFAAELEREKIMERTMRGKRARAEAGRLLPGPRPLYGYRWAAGTRSALVPDDTTAPIVRRLFREIAAGRSLRAVTEGLNAEGVPTPGRAAIWCHTTVRRIVTHPGYTGTAVAYRLRRSHEPGQPTRLHER